MFYLYKTEFDTQISSLFTYLFIQVFSHRVIPLPSLLARNDF